MAIFSGTVPPLPASDKTPTWPSATTTMFSGCQRDASEQDLKSAFRRLAKDHHPDRNPGDTDAEQKFKELNEAYEVLKDPQKRAAYDRFGHAAFDGGMGGRGGGGAGFGPDFASSMSDIFDDLFGEFMGGRAWRRQRPARARASAAPTCATIMEITLDEAFAGKTAQIRVPTSVACETCSGTGAKRRHQADDLRHLRRRRQGAREPGLLHHRAHVPDLPGPRRDHRRPLLSVQRSRPRHEGAHAVGQHSGRASKTARAFASAARARPGCAAAPRAISTFSFRSSRTSSSSATGPTSSAACRSR